MWLPGVAFCEDELLLTRRYFGCLTCLGNDIVLAPSQTLGSSSCMHKKQRALCFDSALAAPSSACFYSLVFMSAMKALTFSKQPCMFRADIFHILVVTAPLGFFSGWFRAGWNHTSQKRPSRGYFFCFSWLWRISQITLGKRRKPQRQ